MSFRRTGPCVRRAVVDDAAAFEAGAGTDVGQPVGSAHGRLVVLHDDNGISLVAQLLQRIDQLYIIPLMQPDGRLVEDVDHIHQARTDLRSEADALPLAAGKRTGGTVERKILQPDVHQEGYTVP